MKPEIWLILIILHLIAASIYTFFIITGRSYLRREFIAILFLSPIAGILAALLVERLNILNKQNSEDVDLPSTILDDDILWKSLKNVDEAGNIIPLEEALLINDNKTRREMILYTLHDNPMKYLDILLIARYNADVETSHYATTVISNAQKDFQNEVQNLSAAISQHPDDIEAIDSYISAVDRYINSGLLEEILLKNQRISFGQVLDKKLSLVPDDKPTLIKKIRNHIKLNESSEAAETLKTLKQFYPRDEDTWIEAIRVCVESHDRTRLKETLSNIKNNPINWSNSGRARLDYWLEDVS